MKTEARVLEAACRIFAEKGYRDTTVADICTAAEANVAAVNYYFDSKKKLYLAAWQHMSASIHKQYFDTATEIRDPVERLRQMIFQRVRHAFDEGPAGQFRKVIHAEMTDPTEAHEEIREQFIVPMLDLLTSTVADIMGHPPSDPTVRRCAFSLQSQLVSLSRLRMKSTPAPLTRLMGTTTPSPEEIDELAEHIMAFAMGGIRAASTPPTTGDHPR